ncbi:MAG TPA: alpha/beta hydrolase [Promineifilum sp.]|nr:alpha/beta hydrolase [Promineifilum sp.]
MKRIACLLFLLSLLLIACSGRTPEDERQPTIPLTACRLSGGVDAQCGQLLVYEDRAAAAGRQISLNIAVLPATGSSNVVADDPLFLLAGGPGQAATETYPLAASLFADVNRNRDIVLVDQRGTGESNGLNCAVLEDETLPADLPDDEQIALLDQCRLDLGERADLSLYTTDAFAADLDDVRAALDYDTINLYGASYGTRAALTYMRRFPERVRSVVLDSVVGPELVLFLQMPQDGQRALDLLFDRCAADDACNEAFPNFRAEYEAVLARLATPQPVTVADPLSNKPLAFQLDRDFLSQLVFNSLYSAEFQGLLPLLIHHAYETGDYAPLIVQGLAITSSASLYPGLLYAVTCSEDAPLIDPAEAESIRAGTSFGDFAARFQTICANWPRADIAADFRDPLQSDIPTLLLSGGADPVTPPEYAAQVAAGLSNSRHIIVPGFGHGVIGLGCMPSLVAEFVRATDPAALDATCLDVLQPPPFFVSFAGPQP